MRILFVSPYVPSAIRVRPYNFIRSLARRSNSVTLICSASNNDTQALAEMREICERVIAVPLGKAAMAWNAFRALPGRLPLQAALNFSPRMLELVRFEARSGRHEVAHVEHLRGAALGYGLLQLPAVLDSVDCISLLFERTLRSGLSIKSRLMALADLARTRDYEGEYTMRYERVAVSSPEDGWALGVLQARSDDARVPNEADDHRRSITVIPNGVDLDHFSPLLLPRDPATLVFSGKMSYHANTAAALFLAHDIMPLVWQRRPDVKLVIAGSAPPRAIQALASDSRISVTGYLPDLRPAIAQATVAVCPLRYGVGIQNKVLEAMAMATPTVVARQAARALNTRNGRDLLLAEHPDEYAASILSLLADPRRAATIGSAGRRYVEQHHSWDTAAARLERLYQEALETYTYGV